MIQKGTMRNVKQVLGWIALILGIGLVFFPIITAMLLVQGRILIGIMLIVLGYLNTKAGTNL